MAMVVAGKLNREIAAKLGTSEITVKVQRSHLMRKMQAASVIDLARMAEKLDVRART
jgi:FixJ family two-component response regulator